MLKLLTEKPQWTVIDRSTVYEESYSIYSATYQFSYRFVHSSFLPGLYTRKSRPELIWARVL